MGTDTARKSALDCHYELYSTESAAQAKKAAKAAKEIDTAIAEASNLAIGILSAADGDDLRSALEKAVKHLVKPVFDKYENLGAHDTEPEWWAVYVIKEHLRNKLGFEPGLDDWEIRGWL